MKKTIDPIQARPGRLLLGFLLFCNALTAYGQFQTTIGFPYPVREKSPGGILTPAGDYLMLGSNQDHPNGISPANGDVQLDWLDNAGNLIAPSKILGTFAGAESAAWIERTTCNGSPGYIIAGDEEDNMLLTLATSNGAPVWSRSIGSPNNVETSACVKMDANGNNILVGTQYNVNTQQSSIIAVHVDCNGNQVWNRTYTFTGYNTTVTSVTPYLTTLNPNGPYLVTGKASPINGGAEQIFVLEYNTGGNLDFLYLYTVAPNSDEIGTCIQAANIFTTGGIWISGYSTDANGNKNVLLMKTGLGGNLQWANNYDITGGDEFANHFEFAANGKLVLAGKAEEFTAFQATKAGDCMLMRLDDATGSSVDWTQVYTTADFSSQGNRVEVTAGDDYFVTGQSLELLSPSQSANNMLAIKTDKLGQTVNTCYHSASTQVIPRMPTVTGTGPGALTIGTLPDFIPINLNTPTFMDPQVSCSPPPCDCDFTWNTGNCFDVTFNANCNNPVGGNYTFSWDIYCDNNPELTVVVGAPNNAFTYTFPCGGGTFQVCLKITDPLGNMCTITHTVVVPSTCCGSAAGVLACHPTDPYKYNFAINYTDPPGSTACSHVLTSPYPLSNVVYGVNTITGCVAVTDPVPLGLSFTLQTNCTCITTGLPMTCTLPFTVATVCCKEICVDNQIVCTGDDEFLVPLYACKWPPVNNVYQVSWYVLPLPATGCPAPWGGPPYQSTFVNNTLDPLLLFPNTLPSDLCIYAVIELNDGPCTQITSNIAGVELCNPNSCTLTMDDYDYCYTGSCVTPGLITLNSTATQPTCFSTVDWFEGNNPVAVQNGGSTFQPPCLSMANDQNCYEDFVYTAVITDDCGQHSCQATIRLYSGQAPIGTLALAPPDVSPVCWAEDATIKFTPNCAGDPAQWIWYERDCLNNITPIQNAGITNNCLNVNELHNGTKYGVGALNGACPNTVEMLVEVVEPAVINNFDAVADPCAEQYVVLSASVNPGVVSCSNAPFPCTYSYAWYKDGFLIGTTSGGTASESFTYLNPVPLPSTVAGNYSCIITEDCCPRNTIPTWVVPIRAACEPLVMGPCFICDGKPETFMVIMVLPPNIPCPDVCTFTWYTAVMDINGNCVPGTIIGTGPSITLTNPGQYFVQSDCNGCIKLMKFDVLGCMSGLLPGQTGCGPVAVEELMPEGENPLRIFPNPTTGEITLEWSGSAPKDARIYITDPMGRRLRQLTIPDAAKGLTTNIDELPSGLYFIKVQSADRLFTVAKLVKE